MSTIGILEDDAVLRNDMSTTLRSLGYEILTFDDADDGMKLCETEAVDLFIVDLFIHKDRSFVMEGGLNFITRLRDSDGLKTAATTPVLAITGGSGWETGTDPLETATLAGATSVLRKPIDLLHLVDNVEAAIGQAEDSGRLRANLEGTHD